MSTSKRIECMFGMTTGRAGHFDTVFPCFGGQYPIRVQRADMPARHHILFLERELGIDRRFHQSTCYYSTEESRVNK